MREFLHHIFLPRESNNHKARVLHHKSLLIILILLLFVEGFFIATENKYSDVLGISASISIQELLDLTNQKRAEKGVSPLTLSTELSNAATSKGADMFAKNYWAHVAPDGATPWGFIRSAGYEYVYAGENLARGFTTSADVVNAWMNSPGHRDNLLSANYKEVGFSVQQGMLTGDETVLVVQEFGSRIRTEVAKETASTASVAQLNPTPTVSAPTPPVRIAQVTIIPSSTPTPAPPVVTLSPTPGTQIASFQSTPLVDAPSAKRGIVVSIIAILLATFIADVILIERKKIVRLFLHNIDHIIYLSILLVSVLIVSRGIVL